VGRRNDDGEKVLEQARRRDLALANTFFTKTDEKIYTYKSSLNQTVIDYFMICREDSTNVKDFKVISGKPSYGTTRQTLGNGLQNQKIYCEREANANQLVENPRERRV